MSDFDAGASHNLRTPYTYIPLTARTSYACIPLNDRKCDWGMFRTHRVHSELIEQGLR